MLEHAICTILIICTCLNNFSWTINGYRILFEKLSIEISVKQKCESVAKKCSYTESFILKVTAYGLFGRFLMKKMTRRKKKIYCSCFLKSIFYKDLEKLFCNLNISKTTLSYFNSRFFW